MAGIICYLILQIAHSQKVEFCIGVDGTLSAFRGSSAVSFSSILLSDVPPTVGDVTINPYGRRPSIGSNVTVTVQQVSKKIIVGLSAGYEALTSKVKITEVESFGFIPADGTTKLTNTFINLFPFVGERFGSNKITFDLNIGMDIGLPLSKHEKGEARLNDGTIVNTDFDYEKPSVDWRPRLQLKVIKNKFGLQSSFSLGLTNYYGNGFANDYKAYFNVFRIGFFYVL